MAKRRRRPIPFDLRQQAAKKDATLEELFHGFSAGIGKVGTELTWEILQEGMRHYAGLVDAGLPE